jgi:hypothetical protein
MPPLSLARGLCGQDYAVPVRLRHAPLQHLLKRVRAHAGVLVPEPQQHAECRGALPAARRHPLPRGLHAAVVGWVGGGRVRVGSTLVLQ